MSGVTSIPLSGFQQQPPASFSLAELKKMVEDHHSYCTDKQFIALRNYFTPAPQGTYFIEAPQEPFPNDYAINAKTETGIIRFFIRIEVPFGLRLLNERRFIRPLSSFDRTFHSMDDLLQAMSKEGMVTNSLEQFSRTASIAGIPRREQISNVGTAAIAQLVPKQSLNLKDEKAKMAEKGWYNSERIINDKEGEALLLGAMERPDAKKDPFLFRDSSDGKGITLMMTLRKFKCEIIEDKWVVHRGGNQTTSHSSLEELLKVFGLDPSFSMFIGKGL